MIILAIDPGPVKSAYVTYESSGGRVHSWNIEENALLRLWMRSALDYDHVVIEKIESYGMAVGAEVFETVFWSGVFAASAGDRPVHRIGRKAIKLHLCYSVKARDTNIRQALIDRYGGSKEVAIGRKAAPGPLYGFKADAWAALAVAVAWGEGAR